MPKKLGRNQPCWCLSGKKYKHCHLHRDLARPVQPWEATAEHKKRFGYKECMVPDEFRQDCTGKIVKAHTIPKSSSLKKIAKNGHVYGFSPTFEKLNKFQGIVPAELVGIGNASTFTGFCSYHDNVLFSPLEDQNYGATLDQDFLLTYRAAVRELYTKQASASMDQFRKGMDRGRSKSDQQQIQLLNSLFGIGVASGLSDLLSYKAELDRMLVSKDFGDLRSFRLTMPEAPKVMVSGGLFPDQDFSGATLQDLADLERRPKMMTVSSFYGGDAGHVVLSWLSDSDVTCSRFVQSFLDLPRHRRTDALIRFFFESFENLYIAPDWWESLEHRTQRLLTERKWHSADPFEERPGQLLDDGLEIGQWHIENVG